MKNNSSNLHESEKKRRKVFVFNHEVEEVAQRPESLNCDLCDLSDLNDLNERPGGTLFNHKVAEGTQSNTKA
ncbi:MAG: hypothetical protein LBF89_10250 [Bacteroidales bacterium]|jgi:hypothetical protein|nr:hypothetical protein [Bacteroidales bacterium]